MRERRYLTFDMNNPHHVEALRLFSAQSNKMRSEYVINCILKAQQEDRIEEMVRHTILEALVGITLQVSTSSKAPSILQPTDNISDLPEVLIDSMDDF